MAINKGYLQAKTDKVSDEYYTPAYAVKPIIKYLGDISKTIWCPFDTQGSEYVKLLREAGHTVIATNIDEGKNFFFYEPEEHYDCIISNPPFSCKDAILARLAEIGKLYAILLPLPTLQGQGRFEDLVGAQALVFDKRINFYTDLAHTSMAKGVSFASIYICKDFLPKDLIFERLEGKV